MKVGLQALARITGRTHEELVAAAKAGTLAGAVRRGNRWEVDLDVYQAAPPAPPPAPPADSPPAAPASPPPPEDPGPLLTAAQFSARAQVNLKLVYRLAGQGSIPGAVRIGSCWRFSWGVFLQQGGVRPVAPLTPVRRPGDFVRADLDRLLSVRGPAGGGR